MKIIENPELKTMSTLKLGGKARAAYYAQDYKDLETLGGIWPELGPEVLIQGRGSNTLFKDGKRDFSLVVWKKRDVSDVFVSKQGQVMVMADAGLSLPGFLGWSAGKGLSGLENLAGIPGSLGGAVAMNAGSFGIEIKDLLKSVTLWTPESGIMEIDKEDMETGYRTFKVRNIGRRFIILKVLLLMQRDNPRQVRRRMKECYLRKKNIQPVLENTAGCVFKNPKGFEPAGILLEKAGFRGKVNGRVCFSQKHANFLVNKGGGSSKAALDLISEARQTVQKMFGADLELEIKVV
ncbi:MAG: UDP-N-acetylmuramate dehydrogenase [Desulfonatronovibrio sp.]